MEGVLLSREKKSLILFILTIAVLAFTAGLGEQEVLEVGRGDVSKANFETSPLSVCFGLRSANRLLFADDCSKNEGEGRADYERGK